MLWLAAATVIIWVISLGLLAGAVRGPGIIRRIRRLLAAAVWAMAGALLGGLLMLLHAFHAFTGETLVAQVTIRQLAPDEAQLLYRPASGHPAQTVRIRGDQWALSGGIIKWHPWLTAVGLRSYHHPMRISGQFSSLARQRAQAPTVYALEPGTDLVWEWASRLSQYLPVIDAVYGSSAYAYADSRKTYDVYVTPSGYMIKHGNALPAR